MVDGCVSLGGVRKEIQAELLLVGDYVMAGNGFRASAETQTRRTGRIGGLLL